MDATSLIGQDAYVAGLQKQTAAQAAAVHGASNRAADPKKVRGAAEQFEAFFIGQMMEHMTAGIETDPMFGGGPGEDMWKSMLNQEYGKEIAKSGRLGIADHVVKGMLKMQEERNGGQSAAPVTNTADAEPDQEFAQQDSAVALVAGSRLPPKR